jgi:hypothetical protein
MALADVLSGVGQVAQAVGKRTADVVSGEAPKLDDEQRKRQQSLEDAALNAKASTLEQQLQMGQKYGTLTPEQQQQYVDQITGLYKDPRHAGTLMEKLRQAIHPNGAYAQGPQAPLPNATPAGGTLSADEAEKEKAESRKLADVLKEIDERGTVAKDNQKISTSKSPPLPGNQLPPDALGPDGQPVNQASRDAGHSFVEYRGAWWPVAKQKPVFKTVKGHSVLVDPQSGNILRDLGPTGTARVTTRQTMQPGDDGQMHLVNLTSVSTPEGGTIEVQAEGGETPPQPQAKGASSGGQTSAKKVNPGAILPKAGAKPATSSQAGPVVPGLSNLANKKIQTTQDRQVLESGKQIISAVDDLLPLLEKRKNEGGVMDAGKQYMQFEAYKMGIPPSDPELTKIFEESALLGVVGASIWSRIGRSKYTFEIIQQHLPKPTDTPKLMYDKVKWLKDNVVPAAQEAIKNPQPDAASGDDAVDEFLKHF